MSTVSVLVGFALMLFLPCAIAVLGSRENGDDSAYSDRIVDPIIRARVPRVLQSSAESDKGDSVAEAAAKPVYATPGDAAQLEVTDPVLPNRAQKSHQARILRNEIEALLAAATAARAQADALAANARLAAAKAEAADAEASAAEEAAAAAIQEMRRAA